MLGRLKWVIDQPLPSEPVLRKYERDRLAGNIARTGGESIAGRQMAWKGRRHGPRQLLRWAQARRPEQIVNGLLIDFPEDTSMRISQEAIYQALSVQGRGYCAGS